MGTYALRLQRTSISSVQLPVSCSLYNQQGHQRHWLIERLNYALQSFIKLNFLYVEAKIILTDLLASCSDTHVKVFSNLSLSLPSPHSTLPPECTLSR
ncbi:hypothetical protein FGO68_gene5554 [Halteria grandinella]|uniref:Uncharacterized protein n=1 Tax=Halteria grandinella TaxID=5974 RepID=A0A8J8N980_HALGN|nr:hypothetical protein FGO68_gene5554 [Halteria grandinella]